MIRRHGIASIILVIAVGGGGMACGTGGSAAHPLATSATPVTSTAATPLPSPASPASSSPASPSPSPSPSPSERPSFHGTISKIDTATRAAMDGSSWHEGCPVAIEDLRLLTLDHWGFDGEVHEGRLIVNREVASDVVGVFETLFAATFPIERMEVVDAYGGDDDRSMAANNTSGFNCRLVLNSPSWSQHSYGWAIDVNPTQNPYVTTDGQVLPPGSEAFLDRSLKAKGLIHAGGTVVDAFAAIGWEWGGSWDSPQDYQHFSLTGH